MKQLIMKMEETYSSETSVDFQETTRRYIHEDGIIIYIYTQSSSTLWNYSKCGVYTVESEAGC
jgi:hypothetical protein